MEIFLDSGNIEQIKMTLEYINISGITTNPKLSTVENALKIANLFQIPTNIQIEYADEIDAISNAQKVSTKWSIVKLPISDLKIGKKLDAFLKNMEMNLGNVF
jgi:transaldolase